MYQHHTNLMQSHYKNLPPDSFRLLNLHPGYDAVDALEATLSTHRLFESPPFDAISYTWGEPRGEGLIHMDGVPHDFRNNLWEFLIMLRKLSHEVCIWVDALCIKQD